jgi:hypothetical protein
MTSWHGRDKCELEQGPLPGHQGIERPQLHPSEMGNQSTLGSSCSQGISLAVNERPIVDTGRMGQKKMVVVWTRWWPRAVEW